MKNIILNKGSTQVTIATTKIERIISKPFLKITPPDVGDTATPSDTLILDLQNSEKRINVDGYIEEDFGTGDTSSTGVGKRNNLLDDIALGGGVFTLTNDGVEFIGNFEKIVVDEINQDEGTTTKFFVKFTLLVGEDMVA